MTVNLPTTVPSLTVANQQDPLSGQWYITPWTNAYDQVLQTTLDVNINPDNPPNSSARITRRDPITVLLAVAEHWAISSKWCG